MFDSNVSTGILSSRSQCCAMIYNKILFRRQCIFYNLSHAFICSLMQNIGAYRLRQPFICSR
nr:MAG TPA: hypothetical protein [Caudoviricetes sp.]